MVRNESVSIALDQVLSSLALLRSDSLTLHTDELQEPDLTRHVSDASPLLPADGRDGRSRRRRRGAPGGNPGVSALLGSWQCQILRPNRPQHEASVAVGKESLTLKWNHVEAFIGKDPLGEAFLGKESIASVNVIACDFASKEGDCLDLHVLTTPFPCSPDGESFYRRYKLFEFRSSHHSRRRAAQECRDAIRRMAEASPLLSGRSRVHIIVNPVSGHRQGKAYWERVEEIFACTELDYSVTLTERARHAYDLVGPHGSLDLSVLDVIVCIGGDGTISEVVNGIMSRPDRDELMRRLVLGTIPAGSECALAKMMSFVTPLAATWTILKGHRVRPVDLIRISQSRRELFSLCGVGWGLGGKLAEDSEALRATYGPARYLVSGLKSFMNLKGCKGELLITGLRDTESYTKKHGSCAFAASCPVCEEEKKARNEQLVEVKWSGSFVLVAMLKSEKALVPFVHINDGYLDVLAIPEVGKLELLRRSSKILVPQLVGSHIQGSAQAEEDMQDKDFWYIKATSVTLVPESTQDKINVDGEVLDGKSLRMEVLPGQLSMFVAFLEGQEPREATGGGLHEGLRWAQEGLSLLQGTPR